jgi:transposase
MEWVTGIGIEGGQFVGNMLSSSIDDRNIHLGDLVTMGIPNDDTNRKMVTQEFSQWRSVDPGEYISGFDNEMAKKVTKGHLVFETNDKRTRILIPALALMRSLFRPVQALLPMVFRAQAIQQVCHLDLSVIPARLIVVANWYKSYLEKLGDVTSALDWMSSFPSAARMAASAHQHALRGIIGLTLPKARARLSLHGKRIGHALHVTKVIVRELKAMEPPFDFAGGASRRITYRKRPPGTAGLTVHSVHVPLRENGSADLTDQEWQLIAPILLKHLHPKKARLDQRLLFDGILRKFAFNLGWSKVQYRVGNRVNATYAFRTWTQKGTFQSSVNVLAASRRTNHKMA